MTAFTKSVTLLFCAESWCEIERKVFMSGRLSICSIDVWLACGLLYRGPTVYKPGASDALVLSSLLRAPNRLQNIVP